MKKLWVCFFFFLPLFSVDASERENVSLVKCVDGDTAVFKVQEEEVKFRFLAVDTPESVHPTKEKEAFGKEASTFTCDALTNAKTIEIEYDEASSKKDKYGRGLAWIYIDGVMLQKTLIENGFAEVAYIYGKYKYVEELCELQGQAILNKKGIWADGTREEGYCKTKSNSTTKKTTKTKKESSKNEEDEFVEDVLAFIEKYPVYAPFVLVVGGVYVIIKKKK